jgi:signal transduction histidine kinase
LPHNNIQQLLIDSKGRVLVATLCSKINYINDNEEVAQIANSSIGPQNLVMSFCEGDSGTIWVGTQGNGIWKIQKGNINYNRASGLLSNFCYSLNLSAEGELVIGHRGGLSLIGTESKRIKTFSEPEGIKSSTEFFPNAVLRDHYGNIWFGTSEGLVQFSSMPSKGGKIPPILHINKVYMDGEEKTPGEDPVILKPGQHEVAVDYIGLHLTNPEMVVYQTQLDGYNTDWSDPTIEKRVVYERLEYGNYTFKIRAFNENNIESEIISAFHFKIKKPIYLTIWFYGILAIILALSFYLTLRIREQNHRMVQERLLKNLDEKSKEIIVKEEIIKERKKVEKILIEAKTKAELSEKLKTSFLQNISHEIRTPMNAIVGFSQLLKKEGLSIETRNEFIDSVFVNAESLLQLIDNILDLSKLETKQLEIKENYCRVHPILTKLEKTFLQRIQMEGKQGIALQKICPVDDSIQLLTDSARLEQILYNLLDNALKFTESGKISFGYTVEEANLLFFVEDTGIGPSEDKIGIVFDLFRKVEDDRIKLYGGTGLGLTLAKYLVNILGGEINLDSKEGVGSKFYFNIPFNNSNNV